MNLKIQVSTVQLLLSQERFHVHTSSTILHCGGRGLQKQIGTARRTPYRNPLWPSGIFMDLIFRFFRASRPIPMGHSFLTFVCWGQFCQIPGLIILKINIARGIFHGSNPVLAGKRPDDIPYGGQMCWTSYRLVIGGTHHNFAGEKTNYYSVWVNLFLVKSLDNPHFDG